MDVSRTDAGYREYPPETEYTLRAIQRAKQLGFSLREIAEVFAHVRAGNGKESAAAAVQRKLREVDAELSALRERRESLEELMEQYREGDRCAVVRVLSPRRIAS